jgi:hypothetical protein
LMGRHSNLILIDDDGQIWKAPNASRPR